MNASENIDKLWLFCDRLDIAWRAEGYATELFPDIVERLAPRAHCELEFFGDLRALRGCLDIPRVAEIQRLSSFSDVYYRLYDNGRFWVEVLNWWGSDINIHDHDFSAVQYQLRGAALNVEYHFIPTLDVDGVVYGTYNVTEARLWRPGDHSTVRPGRVAPHNVCHIDRPTVSLLIRTHPDPTFGPQWNYFPPAVASSYGVADAVFRKNVKSLRLLATDSKEAFTSAVADFAFLRRDPERLFAAVKMVDILFQAGFTDDLVTLLGGKDDLVKSVAYFRVMEEIKYFKNVTNLSFDQKLALSVIGAAFDATSLEDICRQVYGCGPNEALSSGLEAVVRSVTRADAVRMARIMALYGIDLLGLEEAA